MGGSAWNDLHSQQLRLWSSAKYTIFRWWFQTFFYFHPYLGKIPNLTNIFQMGWNHQVDMIFLMFSTKYDPRIS